MIVIEGKEEAKKEFDVVIAGASFAGLAVASRIKKGRVLLIDSKPVGVGIKSACGTVLSTVKKLGLESCVLQTHRKLILHLGLKQLVYKLKYPFGVIDGERFCRRLLEKSQANFWQAKVLGSRGEMIKTDRGKVWGRILVDASGPNSVLTGRQNRHLSFGLETIVNHQGEGLHFWYEPKVFPKGIFWLFPQGETSRVGIGSYLGETNLLPQLKRFLNRHGWKMGKLHGGYFPHLMTDPVVDNIFRVGDAAGQCLPVTGEGIRPALVFGQKCGEIIEKILKGEMLLSEGLRRYKMMLMFKKKYYRAMYWLQKFLIGIPEGAFYPLAWLVSQKPITYSALDNYLKIVES
jgi:flavin-dependent dehydrogenase